MTPAGYGPAWQKLLNETGWWHSFELPDGSVREGVNSLESLRNRVSQFPIPQDLSGKRVLDIGAWDGWFSFEMERRGAQVVAIDVFDNPRFREMHKIYNSRVDYRQMDVYQIEALGRFDIVLFLGVLYHLKHPLLALEKVCAVTRDLAAVDSFILRDNLDPSARPVLEFFETTEMEGQIDNWVAPNLACLMAMCRTAGFARVELKSILPYSACLACFRRWLPGTEPEPRTELLGVAHHLNGGINFRSHEDEYLQCFFSTGATELNIHTVRPVVGEYGVMPVLVSNASSGIWQANFRLPPGLEAGWHPVTVGVRGGPPSNAHRIAVDLPVPRTAAVIDGTHDPGRQRLSIWCSGLPENADLNNVKVRVNGAPCVTEFVAPGPGSRQINVRIPEGFAAGSNPDVDVYLG